MTGKTCLRFELRHLRYVIAVAELGGIRKAARALDVQPSTISRRVRDLEDELGAAVFIRHGAGVRLTGAGERFVRRARKALNHLSHATLDLVPYGKGQSGVIRLGLMSSMASGFIDRLIDAFVEAHPNVRIEYVEGEPAEHTLAIRQLRMDVAFLTGTPVAEDCEVVPLWSERVYVAMASNDQLAAKGELFWTDLRARQFVVSEEQSGPEIHDYLVKHLSDLGRSPSVHRHAVYRDTLMQIVAKSQSLTLTSEATIATQFPGVVYRPLAGELLPFSAVWSSRNDNPAFRRLLSLAKVISARAHRRILSLDQSGSSSPVTVAGPRGALSQSRDPLQ